MMDFSGPSWEVIKSLYSGITDCKEYGRESLGWPGAVGEWLGSSLNYTYQMCDNLRYGFIARIESKL